MSNQPPAGPPPEWSQAGPPPPAAKKRKKWPFILGALIVIIVIIAVSTSGGGDDSSSTTASDSSAVTSETGGAAPAPATSKADDDNAPLTKAKDDGKDGHKVVYEVAADSGAASITYMSEDNSIKQIEEVTLPWRLELTNDASFPTYSVLAQNKGSGNITCRITVDGEKKDEQSASGEYQIANCNAIGGIGG